MEMTTREQILNAIEHRAVNDITRELARTGITLTHAEADRIGDAGAQWLRDRLGLVADADHWGVSTGSPLPSRSIRSGVSDGRGQPRRIFPAQRNDYQGVCLEAKRLAGEGFVSGEVRVLDQDGKLLTTFARTDAGVEELF